MLRLREMRETTDYSIKDVAQKVGVPRGAGMRTALALVDGLVVVRLARAA